MSPLVPLSGRALQWQLWKMQTGACSSPGHTCRLGHQCQQVSALTHQPFQVCFDFTGIRNTSVGGTCSSEFIWKRGSKGPYISPVPSSFMNFRDQVPMIALPQASESLYISSPNASRCLGKPTSSFLQKTSAGVLVWLLLQLASFWERS